MTGDNTLVNVEGEIDAGFTSYGVPSQKEGETVDATEKGEGGREVASLLPDEAPDPEDMTDKQLRVFKCASLHPEYSSRQVAESVGIEVSGSSVRRILKDLAPEWYDDKFVNRGKSTDPAPDGERKKPTRTDMTVEEALEELGGQATSKEVADAMGQSKFTAHGKLRDAEGDTVEAHQAVEGYHNRTKVYTLPGEEVVSRNVIEDVREEQEEEEEGPSLAELFAPPEETDEQGDDHTYLYGEEETEETDEQDDEGSFTKWEKGVGEVQETDEQSGTLTDEEVDQELVEKQGELAQLQAEIEQQQAHSEIRTVCEYEARGDGRTAQLARYVLDRL